MECAPYVTKKSREDEAKKKKKISESIRIVNWWCVSPFSEEVSFFPSFWCSYIIWCLFHFPYRNLKWKSRKEKINVNVFSCVCCCYCWVSVCVCIVKRIQSDFERIIFNQSFGIKSTWTKRRKMLHQMVFLWCDQSL